MIPTLAWKEYREQRPFWLALALLGLVLLPTLAQVLGPVGGGSAFHTDNVLGGVACALAFTYGIVCGAMLLAGERESGTLVFLDILEGLRARLWNTKVLTGTALTLAQALLLAGLATGVGARPREPMWGGWFGVAAGAGLMGLAWGLLGSALARSVLAAVGLAAVFLWLVPLLVALLVALLLNALGWPGLGAVVTGLLCTGGPLWVSRRIFCHLDRGRGAAPDRSAGAAWGILAADVCAVLWLTYRQGRVELLVLAAASLLLGSALRAHFLALWPAVTLLLGVLCGAAVFADEQMGESRAFLGDQRLPLGRVWGVKTLAWLLATALLGALTLGATCFQRAYEDYQHLHHSDGLGALERLAGKDLLEYVGPWTLLTLGLAYGFAAGQFFGLLPRKSVVGVVLAVLVGGVAMAVWVPSLLGGDVALWQVLVVPALLLAGTRLVLRPWAAGRLHRLRPGLVVAVTVALAAAWIAGNLWYRAFALPDVGEPFDVRAFAATLPTPDRNEAGRLIQRASEALEAYAKEVDSKVGQPRQALFPRAKPSAGPAGPPLPAPAPGGEPAGGPGVPPPPPAEFPEAPPETYAEQLDEVLKKGWPKGEPELGRWLDRLFEGEWTAQFREAARLPLGMVGGRDQTSVYGLGNYGPWSAQVAELFAARALQLQARGDNKAGLEELIVALDLSRQFRHKATSRLYGVGLEQQFVALAGVERWLQPVGPRRELLRAALVALNQHEAQLPPFGDYFKTDYLVFENERAFMAGFPPLVGPLDQRLLLLAGNVPWEKERETRLLHALAAQALALAERPLWQAPGVGAPELWLASVTERPRPVPFLLHRPYFYFLTTGSVEGMRQAEARGLCQLHGTRLQVALALYAVEKGRPAATLDALIPEYLPGVPVDPYSGRPFRYRIAPGEQIEMEPSDLSPDSLKVATGLGIVWSVGPDRQDNGGKRAGVPPPYEDVQRWSLLGLDWIFVVPRWPAAPMQDR